MRRERDWGPLERWHADDRGRHAVVERGDLVRLLRPVTGELPLGRPAAVVGSVLRILGPDPPEVRAVVEVDGGVVLRALDRRVHDQVVVPVAVGADLDLVGLSADDGRPAERDIANRRPDGVGRGEKRRDRRPRVVVLARNRPLADDSTGRGGRPEAPVEDWSIVGRLGEREVRVVRRERRWEDELVVVVDLQRVVLGAGERLPVEENGLGREVERVAVGRRVDHRGVPPLLGESVPSVNGPIPEPPSVPATRQYNRPRGKSAGGVAFRFTVSTL